MKTCTKCGVEKTLDSFNKQKASKDGLQYKCKDCTKAYYEENKEKILAGSKVYCEDNKEQRAERSRVWRAANPERSAAHVKAWQLNNPDKTKATWRKRRAKKLEVNENYTKEDEAFTKNLFDHACFNCGSTENLEVDHYRPLSKGNALTLTNAIILCRSCNSSKGPKDPEEFFSEEQTMIIQEVFDRVEEQV